MQKKIKQERGAITVLVLSSIFIILIILVSIYTLLTNQNRTEEEKFRKIQEAYNLSDLEMQELYQKTLNGQSEILNEPELLVGMKKIMFTEPTDETKGEIVQEGEADFDKNHWYYYKEGKWANAQTQDGSMWVWIPRFAYKIEENADYNSDGIAEKGGTIKVKFLIGETDEYYDDDGNIQTAQRQTSEDQTIDATKDYTVHPAFTNEANIKHANGGWSKELKGIWVAKFEAGYASGNNNAPVKASGQTYSQAEVTASPIEGDGEQLARNWLDGEYGAEKTDIKYPTFQGTTYAMNYISTEDAYYISRALIEDGNIYGLTSNTDSHLMKNSEWGAVAYLSQSQYGRNGIKPYINNVSLNSGNNDRTSQKGRTGVESVYGITGVTGGTEYGNTKIEDIVNINNTIGDTPSIEGIYTWNQKTGKEASTTGTIYGIYDLNGGLWESTADYIANGSESLKKYGANFATGEDSQYTKIYEHDKDNDTTRAEDTETNLESIGEQNYMYNTEVYGDAIHETSKNGMRTTSWYNGFSQFMALSRPFSIRGGDYSSSENTSIFAFSNSKGEANYNTGFRAVLVSK